MAKHKDLYFSLKRNFKIVPSPPSVLESKEQGRGCRPVSSVLWSAAEGGCRPGSVRAAGEASAPITPQQSRRSPRWLSAASRRASHSFHRAECLFD